MSNILLQIFITILAIIVTNFVTKKRERWKFTEEIKQRHLKEIKEQVFEPLLEILNSHWFPILERKRVNLVVKPTPTYEGDGVTSRLVSTEYSLDTYEEPEYLTPINQHLYKDARDQHYTQILKRYENFKHQAEEYVKNCLSYADEIKKEIKQGIHLPEYNPLPGKNMNFCEWISSDYLAIFVIRKQVVENDVNLSLHFSPVGQFGIKEVMYEHTRCAISSTPENIKQTLNELLRIRKKADELIAFADKLRIECFEIKNEIDKLCLSPKLIGDCDFIKF